MQVFSNNTATIRLRYFLLKQRPEQVTHQATDIKIQLIGWKKTPGRADVLTTVLCNDLYNKASRRVNT